MALVSEKYILRRWRRDVKREHTTIKLVGIGGKWVPEMDRQTYLQNLFCKAIDLAVDSQEKSKFLANCIQEATKKLVDGSWVTSSSVQMIEEVADGLNKEYHEDNV